MSEADPRPSTDVITPSVSEPTRLKLQVVDGPDFGKGLLIESGTYRIGKDPASDLALEDPAVSRAHLFVEALPSGLRITDTGSRNGSFYEGVRFQSVEVRAGAAIRIGRTILKVAGATQPGPATPPSTQDRFGKLVGTSLAMRQIFARLERISQSNHHVLVRGETGTGKELCARAIHDHSPRANGPWVICDVSTLTPTLLESELFGHIRGAFTDASSDRKGAFERAHGGTLFLDEIGELPAESQPRLLRAIEAAKVKRVGDSEYRSVDVRVIAATHRDLPAEVAAGRFRSDLYQRLAVLTVSLPPLRDRPEDLPLLIDELLKAGGRDPAELSAETRALLAEYPWPGNIRELRNVIERVISLGSGAALELIAPFTPGSQSGPGQAIVDLPFKEAKELLVNAFERDYLVTLLKTFDGNVKRASEHAGIDRVYLYRLMKKHGVEAER